MVPFSGLSRLMTEALDVAGTLKLTCAIDEGGRPITSGP